MSARDPIRPPAAAQPEAAVGAARPETFALDELFAPAAGGVVETVAAGAFRRLGWDVPGRLSAVLDQFADAAGTGCCFVRVATGAARTVRFAVAGTYRFKVCASGGWLLEPADVMAPAYWIPRAPMLRRVDRLGHVLSERTAPIGGFDITSDGMAVDLEVSADTHLDWIVWCLPAPARAMAAALEEPSALERQPLFLWGSKTLVRSPADVYLHLIHGAVYANDFVFPRHWKFFSEHDAHALYMGLDGLEFATGKRLYGLLKRQVLHSVIARQAADGRWENGEWTDLMESHYRSHNSAMLMMATALEERPDPAVRAALHKAAAYSVSRMDKTDLGLWFLHDSLEECAEAMDEMLRQTGTRWIPSRALGKSPCNKLILNTHIDAVIALDRHREVTGDDRHASQLASARGTTLGVLRLRPAQALYRALYWAVGLTLLPQPRAEALPMPLRAVKRLTWKYLIPHLHRVKQRYPRMVMPGGLIERHLSSLHFGTHYHAVNLMDLVRHRRRFPEDDIGSVIDGALGAGQRLLDHWGESKNRRFALVVWADALYHLCTLEPSLDYRRQLADAMLRLVDLGLGLPPSLLGADAEAVRPTHRVPCPSPADPRLRVANLSSHGRTEFIVVNSAREDLPLAWDATAPGAALAWSRGDDGGSAGGLQGLRVPARGWVRGHANEA
jgi:hypothetical protein